MLGKNYTYRWYSLSDIVGKSKSFALQGLNKNAAIRGNTYAFANSFGSSIGPRLPESRLFSFTGRIHNVDEAYRERIRDELSSVFHIESDLNNSPVYDLTWDTKYGEPRTAKCSVYTPFQSDNEVRNPVIDYNFELVSSDPRIYDPREVVNVWWLAQMGAGTLWNILPIESGDDVFDNAVECVHNGDRTAPLSIRIEGTVVNPKIFIISGGYIVYSYKLDTTTTDLLIDNRNTTSLTSAERFIVTDNGIDVSQYRKIDGGGWPLYLPGSGIQFWGTNTSYVAVLADNYIDAVGDTVVTVSYRHTYSH